MKTLKHFLFFIPLIFSAHALCQVNFSTKEYNQFRESVRGIDYNDLKALYERKSVYYSQRTFPSNPSAFDYMDSIILKLGITPAETELISTNHFMVSERLGERSFANAYSRIFNNDLPLFLSTDFFLHTLHSSYDEMLKILEINILKPGLEELLTDLRLQLADYYLQNNPGKELLQSVKDVDLYLSTAISLLKDQNIPPDYDDSGLYHTLMAELNDPVGILNISLFSEHTRNLDVSQFIPRGHYVYVPGNSAPDLSGYFKAMMWLGRVDFMLTPPPTGIYEEPWTEQDMRRMAMDALLLNRLLNDSPEKQNLLLHEKITSFFVGQPDNLSPEELSGIVSALGLKITSILNDTEYQGFIERLTADETSGQKILSNFFYVDADQENPAELPVSYKLLGQKFILDSYIFSQVVYDKLYYEGQEVMRMMPDPLDAMFVLGNDDALELLKDEVDEWHYGYKLAELRYLTDAYDREFWEQSLYNSWLDAIRALNPLPENYLEGVPYFMRTTAWHQEKLNTQLASWTELRHDNVLYAKQSYTGGASCSFPHVFVEPYPDFYSKLATFAANASAFFSREMTNDLKDNAEALQVVRIFSVFFNRYGELMSNLQTIASKELQHESLTNEEITFLKQFFNIEMICGNQISGWYRELFFLGTGAEKEDYLAVDVHTQPTDAAGNIVGNVLHAGTGDINLGVFIAGAPTNNYRQTAFVGPLMSFHTRIEQNFNRLDDEAWKSLYPEGSDGYDGRPDWVNLYLAGKSGEKRGEGRTLMGNVYDQTGVISPGVPGNIGYFICWPNPAANHTTFHFFVNETQKVTLNIYDISGRHIKTLINTYKTPGEYNCRFNTAGLSQGIYIARLTCGNDSGILRIIVGD